MSVGIRLADCSTMTAERPAEPTDPATRAREIADRLSVVNEAARYAGIELVEIEPERALLRLVVGPHHVNGHGVCHGGFVFLLADEAFGYACNSAGTPTVASGGEISFLLPARIGDELHAEANLRTLSGRSGIYDVTVRSSAGVVAEFRGRSRAVPNWSR
jgi:acyl-CoA thioesterase